MNSISRKLLSFVLISVAILFLAPAANSLKGQAATTAIQSETTDAAKKDACEVCHNGNHPHTVFVPCNKVNNYLAGHPGDYAGPCTGISPEKPPKPSPTPKP